MEWFGHQGRWGMSNFPDMDRQTGFLLPPSVDEWLPQRHLARFVVEVIDGLDLRVLFGSYRGSGSASYHPSMLLGLLRERSVCEPEVGAHHLRFDGVSLHCGQWPSGPRHDRDS